MIHVAAKSEIEARLARIEAALVQCAGLLRCLEVEGVPEQWHSQVEEKREMLQQAAIDAIRLQQDILSTPHGSKPGGSSFDYVLHTSSGKGALRSVD